MILTTKFSIGDVVYAAYGCELNTEAAGPLTIGMVRAELTDSPGTDPDTMFDNYKPHQCSQDNSYMCVETGIGSGSGYAEDRLFSTREGAQAKLDAVVAKYISDRAEKGS